MPLPETRQILAGIWLRLRILAPILLPILAALELLGISLATDTKITSGLALLVVLALDAAFRPVPPGPYGARR
jgi:hypothetical protein